MRYFLIAVLSNKFTIEFEFFASEPRSWAKKLVRKTLKQHLIGTGLSLVKIKG